MKLFETYKDDHILFIETALIAINQGDLEAALHLLKAAEILDSKNIFQQIGFGYLHLRKLEAKQALTCFQKALDQDPESEMARAFLGIATSMIPDQADIGESILSDSKKSKTDEIKNLADVAIDFIEKHVKKSPGPAGPPHKKK